MTSLLVLEDRFQGKVRIEMIRSEPVTIEERRLIFVPRVAKNRDDGLTRARFFGEAHRSGDIKAFDILCDATLTDSFRNRIAVVCFQIPVGKPGPHRRAVWIGANDLDLRILFLEIAAYTGKSSAGANGCDKCTHLALGLFPDFRASAPIMRVTISRVIELVRPEPAS